MISIIIAAAVVGVVGVLAGILLGVASEKFKVKEVPVEMHEREFGTSSIKPLKSIYYMFSVSISIIIASISGEMKK